MRAIADCLNLNVELTEAIALAHDLGHTPFGHQGERTLDDILKNKIPIIKHFPSDTEKNPFGGFKHNFQGLRVVCLLEESYIDFEGLDLSYQVLEGVLKHTGGNIKNCDECRTNCEGECYDLNEFFPRGSVDLLYPDVKYKSPTTLEGQIVFLADEIAQRGHDLDDSFSAGILKIEDLTNYLSLQKMSDFHDLLNRLQNDVENAISRNRAFVDFNEFYNSKNWGMNNI